MTDRHNKVFRIILIILGSLILGGAIIYFLIFHTNLFLSQKDRVFLSMTKNDFIRNAYDVYSIDGNYMIDLSVTLDSISGADDSLINKLPGLSLQGTCIYDNDKHEGSLTYKADYNAFKLAKGTIYFNNEAVMVDAPALFDGYISYYYLYPRDTSIIDWLIDEYKKADFYDPKDICTVRTENRNIECHRYVLTLHGQYTDGYKANMYIDKKGNLVKLECDELFAGNISYSDNTCTIELSLDIDTHTKRYRTISTVLVISMSIDNTDEAVTRPSGKEYNLKELSVDAVMHVYNSLKEQLQESKLFKFLHL